MSIIAEVTVPLDALPGESVFESLPHAEIELQQVVPTDESALPFFWVWDGDGESFPEAAKREPHIRDLERLSSVQDGALYSANWEPEIDIIGLFSAHNIVLLEGTGTADGWFLRLRAKRRTDIANLQQSLAEHRIHVDMLNIYEVSEKTGTARFGLTPKQRETLVAAYEAGYFEAPREATQEDLGAELDVSSRAVSDRIRRGIRQIVERTLVYTT